MVIPHLTENYGASRDPREKQAPMCTVQLLPHNVDHCLTWARSEFEGLLGKTPAEENAYFSSPNEYTSAMKNAGDDDDTNYHMDLIAGFTNTRARNSIIQEVDKLKAKIIAGRIIPAITTSTALATGLVCMELYKCLKRPSKNELYLEQSVIMSPSPSAKVIRPFLVVELANSSFAALKNSVTLLLILVLPMCGSLVMQLNANHSLSPSFFLDSSICLTKSPSLISSTFKLRPADVA
ncbi:hypothetical protein RJ640_009855 [Escallonia rubra]|uniref:Ubiquitin-activating enzyme SCCH domain-containing protein n=1 Tax=Escallonia rubra TaxID=112253 RepID=A0AA88QR07_9ASTE|nr:hypothetical protein RJ640_009855 [Escallonia rubra]